LTWGATRWCDTKFISLQNTVSGINQAMVSLQQTIQASRLVASKNRQESVVVRDFQIDFTSIFTIMQAVVQTNLRWKERGKGRTKVRYDEVYQQMISLNMTINVISDNSLYHLESLTPPQNTLCQEDFWQNYTLGAMLGHVPPDSFVEQLCYYKYG